MCISTIFRKGLGIALAAVLLFGALPALSAGAEAAGGRYYPVDFSDAMLKSGVKQQISGDCMFVSVVTMEAYMVGATSGADKNAVYSAVKNANPGSTSKKPNAEVIQSTNWGKTVGYEDMKYSLENLYREISRGNPVMIYRAGKPNHWSVVCGYTGSSSRLEESGFQMVNVTHDGVFKTNLKSWRNGKSIIGCKRRTFGVMITDFSGIRFCVDHPAVVQKKGETFGAFGGVVSDSRLTEVTLSVKEVFTGKSIYSKSVDPKAKSCDVRASFDKTVTMAKWGEGEYYYVITARDADGRSKTYKAYFTIRASYPSEAPTDPARTLTCVLNRSGKNYLFGSDFASLDSGWYASRDTKTATLAVDGDNRHDGYNSLRITNSAPGASGKDLRIRTLTNTGVGPENGVGDSKQMVLSFWAKSAVNGTKLYFRWGYESTKAYRSVTLTTEWRLYTVTMDKEKTFGNYIHPYADRKGTVWLAQLQLEDGTQATAFAAENGGVCKTVGCCYTQNYTLPSDPQWEGHVFDGWYTAAAGGTRITDATAVRNGNLTVYAHWKTVGDSIGDAIAAGGAAAVR